MARDKEYWEDMYYREQASNTERQGVVIGERNRYKAMLDASLKLNGEALAALIRARERFIKFNLTHYELDELIPMLMETLSKVPPDA